MKKLSILFALISTTLVCAQTIDKKSSDTLKDHQVKTIQEVIINGKKPIVENKVDKIVYNVANDVTSQSGAAIDVLRKVPQVTVDADGIVELQGNPNVRFLINGKPSSIFGNSLADALASIPASQIKSIEAITSPGSKYDAQGTGGIINIVLNESKVKGINGLITASAGTRFETGSLNLNFRNNNFSLNTFFSGNAQLKSRTPFSQDRISHTATTQTRLLQDGYTDFQRHGYRTGLGFDWTINKTNTLSGSISYNDFANKSIGFINQQQYIADFSNSTDQSIIGYRASDNRSSVNSIDGNLSYRKIFQREGQELTADFVVSYGSPKSNYLQTQSLAAALSPYDGISGRNPGTDTSHNLSVDYVQPINDQITLEMGTKAIFQHITTNTDVNVLDAFSRQYEFDPFQSYRLKYDMGVYAAYVSSSLKLFNNWLDVRAGARYEYTTVKIDYQNTNIPSYSLLVPSFILSHKFDSGETIKLAYTRRVERPEYAELNPFLNFSDPHNITTGNPALKPEIGDNMELGYNKNFENGANLSFTLTERINSQDLKQITTFYPIYTVSGTDYTNVSVTRRDNIGKEYNSGGILSGSVAFLNNKLNLRGNMMVFHRYIVSNYFGNVDMGMRYRLNLNLNYLFPTDFIVEAFGNFNSAAKNIQGKNPQSITYSIAARKQFWNKKASIGITTTNPFNKYIKQATTVETGDYSSSSVRYLPLRSFGISFSYKFGKDFKKEKDISDDYLNAASQGN
ncbi:MULTISPECIES: outer membrane beta-barrel family protein [Chryseobacterium group]|uniref:TonB-dependent receptor n=2 Tax=Chryseobacterium TaxID=59732 RepID=A0AAD1DQF6_CHRNA|nr:MULTISPECIES: outer membrane beta-barrel family protein [Chryseobacterium group]AZA89794.1 TonB-dependent receptor [Chryseobacterium nakagawai]SEQ77398.1 Outer membrane receptor proteins, mostly Fe transport [Epilithonimonas lactis]SMP11794.1 Outer membrane receptor proteins, mostly Fe transport [Chryseobacterium profundimaris]VEH21189.1 TonB-dependent receptor [Chryseobacterium nakagawai]